MHLIAYFIFTFVVVFVVQSLCYFQPLDSLLHIIGFRRDRVVVPVGKSIQSFDNPSERCKKPVIKHFYLYFSMEFRDHFGWSYSKIPKHRVWTTGNKQFEIKSKGLKHYIFIIYIPRHVFPTPGAPATSKLKVGSIFWKKRSIKNLFIFTAFLYHQTIGLVLIRDNNFLLS